MKKQSLRRQALITAICSGIIRGMGFLIRLMINQALGAEAVGVMELASGAHMLALAPAASGLPAAVSRLTAKAEREDRELILYAGRRLALRMAAILCPLFFFGAPLLTRLLGEPRVLPSLMIFPPCVLIVGLSSVYDGYCYGSGNAWPPSLSEMAEQVFRLLLTLCLLSLLPRLTVAWRAAAPALASTLGEGAGLILSVLWVGAVPSFRQDHRLKETEKRLWKLSCPLIINRFSHTLLRTLCGTLIPARLLASGLSQSESMSRLGMLSGMVMPLLFLPGMLSGALGTVGGPAAAKCRTRKEENRLALRLLLPALLSGLACGIALYFLAPFIAGRLYRLPEIVPLLRTMLPLCVLMPLQQVLGGLMNGLGLQKKALRDSLLGAAVTLLFTYRWTGDPALRIYGAGYASLLGHAVTLLCTALSFSLR